MALTELLSEIHEQCSKSTWSKGVQLSRRDCVNAERQPKDSQTLALRVFDRDRGVSAKVELYPDEQDWSSDCHCHEDPCYHVVAAAIVCKKAQEKGGVESLPQSTSGALQIVYKLAREPDDNSLRFERMVGKLGDQQDPLRPLLGHLSQSGLAARGLDGVAPTKSDLAIDSLLQAQKGRIWTSDLWRKILSHLRHCDHVQWEGQKVDIALEELGLILDIKDDGPGIFVKARLDERVSEQLSSDLVLAGQTIHPAKKLKLSPDTYRMLKKGHHIGARELTSFASETLPVLAQQARIENVSKNLPELGLGYRPRPAFDLQASRWHLKVTPVVIYSNPPLAMVGADGYIALDPREIPQRDRDGEQKISDQFSRDWHLSIGQSAHYEGLAAVEFVSHLKDKWRGVILGNGIEQFQVKGELQPSIQWNQLAEEPLREHEEKMNHNLTDGLGFDLQIEFTLEKEHEADGSSKAQISQVMSAWQRGESLVPLMDGGWAKIPSDWLGRHGPKLAALLAAKKSQNGFIPATLTRDVKNLLEASGSVVPTKIDQLDQQMEIAAAMAQKTTHPSVIDDSFSLPTPFHAQLRDYQKIGFNWLKQLQQLKCGALLADDMGLGKTLQSISVITSRTLIIAPTSVLPNWQKELKRFRPNLKVSFYHGKNRHLDEKADVVLTSYGLLRQDQAKLRCILWNVLILDEAHVIKNATSAVHQAAISLRSQFRIALSGTPVENSLDDLWSLYNFLNPGLLGHSDYFRSHYIRPIESGKAYAASALRSRIAPFFLRRLKKEVAKELPPKTEKILHVELSKEEREIYETVYLASQKDILEKLNMPSSSGIMEALEALLRMRQACCHPRLVPGQSAQNSSKLLRLVESLKEILAEGHAALVFSQWTSFLDLIGQALSEAGMDYLRLDGSSQNRGQIVEKFQRDDGPPILIMSLKAGGVGLNLSRADHVYLTDPWWNPFAEDQATDRAHRIGQSNPVMVHPLVALDTVEEKIIALQHKKRELALLATGDFPDGFREEAVGKGRISLERDEIRELLS